jgi:hypothetical protein
MPERDLGREQRVEVAERPRERGVRDPLAVARVLDADARDQRHVGRHARGQGRQDDPRRSVSNSLPPRTIIAGLPLDDP